MKGALQVLLLTFSTMAFGQASQTSIRVEVKTDAGPVRDALVTVSGQAVRTGQDGIAIVPVAAGKIEVAITKEGFFAAHTSVAVTASEQAELEVELQPEKDAEEEVTVYATRTNVRLQDSPLHVEVVGQDEINEELAMRPGDISMMLNEMGGMRVQTTSRVSVRPAFACRVCGAGIRLS